MKDYLIRIYRREKNNPRILVGVVEEVGVEEEAAGSGLAITHYYLKDKRSAPNKGQLVSSSIKRCKFFDKKISKILLG